MTNQVTIRRALAMSLTTVMGTVYLGEMVNEFPAGRLSWGSCELAAYSGTQRQLRISRNPDRLCFLQMRHRKIVLQPGKGALGTVWYMAMDLEAYTQGGVTLAVKAGVTQ